MWWYQRGGIFKVRCRLNRVVTSSGIDTEYRYDGLGRISKLIDRGLATAEDPSGTIAYHYDPLGRKARVERPNGVSSLFDYEPATGFTSQIKHEKSGGENVLTLDYADRDATGIITQIIETRGPAASQTTRDWSYTYDGLKRLATATEEDGARFFENIRQYFACALVSLLIESSQRILIMHAVLPSFSVLGVDAVPISVEVDVIDANSMDTATWSIVGLGDTAIRESKERVKSAMRNSGFSVSQKRITVNLAPADLKKEGSHLDLSMALALLVGTSRLDRSAGEKFAAVGELGLGGEVRSIPGALPIALGAKKRGLEGLLVPIENAREAAVVAGLPVYGVRTLAEAIGFLKGDVELKPTTPDNSVEVSDSPLNTLDFADVRGQESVKRAMEIACSGSHNVILVGSPGSGKTMLAKRLPSILPRMTFEESIETTKIHSIAGLLSRNGGLVTERPFRSPHHTASSVAIVGGGAMPRPGEVSLSHNGILFLDEIPEFTRNVLEVLRQPLEDREVTVSRAQLTVKFPASFILCATMNPCPCGNAGHPTLQCNCHPGQVQRYLGRVSGPLMDRIDLHINVPAVRVEDLQKRKTGEPSSVIRARVQAARNLQAERFASLPLIHCNAQMGSQELDQFCKLDPTASRLLRSAMEGLNLSARAYARILKIARTIADLDGIDQIKSEHISEAVQYRTLDRVCV